ncbi:MAG: branched-chain amino acid ABC transporter permease [Pseudomonadota bacterium]
MRASVAAILIFALCAAIPVGAEVWGGSYLTGLVMRAMILAIAALSLDLLIGTSGLVSFGHAAFLGIGAYTAGIAITEGVTDLATILAVAVGLSALFALITGAISLRTHGVTFIMITLAFGQMLFFTFQALSDYGGDDGLTLWEQADAYGLFRLEHGLFYLILVTLVGLWLLLGRLREARFGRVLLAAKVNATRMETLGYNVFRYRLVAYVIAGVIAGIAGVLNANEAEFVSPAISAWQRSGDLIIVVILGGMGRRTGPVIGALAFVGLEEVLSSITHDWRLIFGPLLIVIVLFAKGGLASIVEGRRA